MKRFLKIFGAAGLVAGMLMAGGCGDSDSKTQGKVVKAPVNGATVTYSDGTTTTTGSNGTYTYNGLAVTTSGGSYTDMNGAVRHAPDMATPAGKTNVTPLTTLYVNASDADKVKLLDLLGTASIDTVVTGTVTGATNVLVAKLNESLGEVLTQLNDRGTAAPSATYLAGLAAQIATLTPTTALAATSIVAAINANTVPTTVTIDTTAVTAIANLTNEGSVVPTTGPTADPTTPPLTTTPPPTSSTGSTGSTGGTSVN